MQSKDSGRAAFSRLGGWEQTEASERAISSAALNTPTPGPSFFTVADKASDYRMGETERKLGEDNIGTMGV